MIRFITTAGILVIAGILASFGTSTLLKQGSAMAGGGKGKWKTLFDGKTYSGWHLYGRRNAGTCWQIENEALHLVPVKDRQNRGDLLTDQEFENFELKLEWKVAEGSNSGIIFLVHEDTARFRESYFTGLEMQVLDNIGADDNKKENHLAGTLYDLVGKATDSRPRPAGEWNQSEIICDRGHLKLFLNGHLVVSTGLWDENWKSMVANSKFKTMPAFGTYKSGRIALQYHGGEVWYRNIRVRNLN